VINWFTGISHSAETPSSPVACYSFFFNFTLFIGVLKARTDRAGGPAHTPAYIPDQPHASSERTQQREPVTRSERSRKSTQLRSMVWDTWSTCSSTCWFFRRTRACIDEILRERPQNAFLFATSLIFPEMHYLNSVQIRKKIEATHRAARIPTETGNDTNAYGFRE
jgi:hypothetical protein